MRFAPFTLVLSAALVATMFAGPAPAADPTAAAAGATCSPDPAAPKRQLRADWIASVEHIDWPSAPGLTPEQQKAELSALYDQAVDRGLNAVIVQVRPTADTFWPSRLEPWSKYLTGTPGRRPGLRPAAVRRARGARAQPGVPRLVQPLPGLDEHRPRRPGARQPGAPAPRLGGRVRRQALLRPRAAPRSASSPRRDPRRGASVRRRRACTSTTTSTPTRWRARSSPTTQTFARPRRRLPRHRGGAPTGAATTSTG